MVSRAASNIFRLMKLTKVNILAAASVALLAILLAKHSETRALQQQIWNLEETALELESCQVGFVAYSFSNEAVPKNSETIFMAAGKCGNQLLSCRQNRMMRRTSNCRWRWRISKLKPLPQQPRVLLEPLRLGLDKHIPGRNS
jgi:hypothetical protein